MRVRLALGVSFLLLVASCGGGTGATTTVTTAGTTTTAAATTTTTVPGFEVVSEDGDLTVEVPFEAMASDPGITITLLTGDQYPPELAGAADDPDARIYDLGPAGLEFAAPVTVTRRIDAARFEGMGPSMAPAVVLMTYDAATATYSLYDDLRVTRNGDDVFVSGTTTHFSPAIAVHIGGYVEANLDDYHLGYATEVGSSLTVGYRYYDSDIQPIDGPSMVTPIGFSRSVALRFGTAPTADMFNAYSPPVGGMGLQINCDKAGEFMPRLGVTVSLSLDEPEELDLDDIAELIPLQERFEIAMKVAQEVLCLDPATSFLLAFAATQFSFYTDHPGGEEFILNENYYGGASGLKVDFAYDMRLEGAWLGLICDNDADGEVDINDTFFAPWALTREGDNLSYVAPLYNYGRYFVYVADASQFSAAPEGDQWTVGAALSAFKSNYTGTGRFESSIGVLGTGDLPFAYEVGPEEGQSSAELAPRQFVTRINYQF